MSYEKKFAEFIKAVEAAKTQRAEFMIVNSCSHYFGRHQRCGAAVDAIYSLVLTRPSLLRFPFRVHRVKLRQAQH